MKRLSGLVLLMVMMGVLGGCYGSSCNQPAPMGYKGEGQTHLCSQKKGIVYDALFYCFMKSLLMSLNKISKRFQPITFACCLCCISSPAQMSQLLEVSHLTVANILNRKNNQHYFTNCQSDLQFVKVIKSLLTHIPTYLMPPPWRTLITHLA